MVSKRMSRLRMYLRNSPDPAQAARNRATGARMVSSTGRANCSGPTANMPVMPATAARANQRPSSRASLSPLEGFQLVVGM